MQVVLAEGLGIRQPLIAAIDGLRKRRLSREINWCQFTFHAYSHGKVN